MANLVAYPDLALKNLTGLDPNEDAKDFLDIVEKKIAFSLGTGPEDAGNDQDAYDNRQKALFGSFLRNPTAQWYRGSAACLPWNDIRDRSEMDSLMIRISIEDEQKQKTKNATW